MAQGTTEPPTRAPESHVEQDDPGERPTTDTAVADPGVAVGVLFRNLRSSAEGLTGREAARRLLVYGPNQLTAQQGRRWPAELLEQVTNPLALLLAAAAVLAGVSGTPALAVAIVAVIALNSGFSFLQERHAEHAVEALAAYLPSKASVQRDGARREVDARELVPGDVLLVAEGDRVSADGRLISGTIDLDLSTLTGESQPVTRAPGASDPGVALLEADNMVFSGSACLGGEARALVTSTGMQTEIGRIAALSQRTTGDSSPLESQVKRVARLIGILAVVVAGAFLPIGLAAGLTVSAAISFAVGLLVANVPEGLLPTITLALAAGVQDLAKKGAVVKRLSAVETLGSTTVICTDKTGTLTQNRMQVVDLWTETGTATVDDAGHTSWSATTPPTSPPTSPHDGAPDETHGGAPDGVNLLALTAARCCTAQMTPDGMSGDPTEVALVELAAAAGLPAPAGTDREALFRFDPRVRLMTTIDRGPATSARWIDTKGAPEAVLPICTDVAVGPDTTRPLTEVDRQGISVIAEAFAVRGLRVLGIARRPLVDTAPLPTTRQEAESGLCLVGLVALLDPARPEAAAAIARAHRAGIRVHVVTGDNGSTASEIAHQVGIGTDGQRSVVVTGNTLDAMSEPDLDRLLESGPEIVFARSSPEAKLRIADALRSQGEVVAMTGDGVNDAPALRAADIGVAMGRSGTEVARQAAAMVLTDDDFATVIDAVQEGRRVYDNIRKFIFYIFTHAVPEVAPFLVFALSGGAVPLPVTVMQLLAIDLITDTLPALALSREPAEPGIMDRAPRPGTEGIIRPSLLLRSWGFLGVISAVLVLGGFFLVLHQGGWHPGAPTGVGTPLHQVYRQATTIAWLGIVFCQVGTAFAARTDRVSLRSIGFFSNRLLLGAIAIALVLAAAITYLPFLQTIFGTAAPSARQLVILLPFPFVVWGADEIRRWIQRHRHAQVPDATKRDVAHPDGAAGQPPMASSSTTSSADSSRPAAAMFSSRWSIDEVPGMSRMLGERWRSQA